MQRCSRAHAQPWNLGPGWRGRSWALRGQKGQRLAWLCTGCGPQASTVLPHAQQPLWRPPKACRGCQAAPGSRPCLAHSSPSSTHSVNAPWFPWLAQGHLTLQHSCSPPHQLPRGRLAGAASAIASPCPSLHPHPGRTPGPGVSWCGAAFGGGGHDAAPNRPPTASSLPFPPPPSRHCQGQRAGAQVHVAQLARLRARRRPPPGRLAGAAAARARCSSGRAAQPVAWSAAALLHVITCQCFLQTSWAVGARRAGRRDRWPPGLALLMCKRGEFTKQSSKAEQACLISM